MNQRILVGCPTSNHKAYCLEPYIKAVTSLSYPGYDIMIVDNSKEDAYHKRITELLKKFAEGKKFKVVKDEYAENFKDRIVHSRNLIRNELIKNKYDYFLSLEQDVIPPKDVIERLLSHSKDVVTGVYFKEYFAQNTNTGKVEKLVLPLIYKTLDEESLREVEYHEIEGSSFMKVTACGLGCILISAEVLKDIKFRHNEKYPAFDDMYFCKDADQLNVPIFADTTVKCRHLHRATDWRKIKHDTKDSN